MELTVPKEICEEEEEEEDELGRGEGGVLTSALRQSVRLSTN